MFGMQRALAVIYFVRIVGAIWRGYKLCSTESIMQALTAKVGDLKERLQTDDAHEEIAPVCTTLFLGEDLNISNGLSEVCLISKRTKSGCPAIAWVQSTFIC